MTAPNYQKVKRVVRDLLSEFGVEHPPVDPLAIATSRAINVKFVEFTGKFESVSGLYEPKERTIFVNKHDPAVRQTFTIAHELGHALLHEEWAKSENYRLLWRDSAYNGDESHEKEANAFAANLLVPRQMLDKFSNSLNVAQMSRLFAVSTDVIRHRMALEYDYRA